MSALREVSLLNCSTVIPHLTLCNSLAFVRTWPLRLPVCVSLFVFVCVFLTLIFSAASLPLILCWHGERAAGSLHSNLPSFVITCPCDTKTRTHTRTHTHTHTRPCDTKTRAHTPTPTHCLLSKTCQYWRPCDCVFGLPIALYRHLWFKQMGRV